MCANAKTRLCAQPHVRTMHAGILRVRVDVRRYDGHGDCGEGECLTGNAAHNFKAPTRRTTREHAPHHTMRHVVSSIPYTRAIPGE